MNNINVQQSQEQYSSNHPIALDEKAELIYASAFNEKQPDQQETKLSQQPKS